MAHYTSLKIIKPPYLQGESKIPVLEVEYEQKKLKCYARKTGGITNWENVEKYVKRLTTLSNPNAVRYLPICNILQLGRVLLREFVHQSLTDFLGNEVQSLSFIVQVNLSHDISKGLLFLHSRRIIHGNLTSNNVLVTENERAKLCDYGMFTSDLKVLCKPNMKYLPLNMRDSTFRNKKSDVFSFGIVAIQILNRQPDPTSERESHNEEDRWQQEIDKIDSFHPLCQVIINCIKDNEEDRPESDHIQLKINCLRRSKLYCEINDLGKEKQKLQSEFEKQQEKLKKISQLPLSIPSKKWIQEKQAEVEMRRSADAVTDGKNVYLRLSHTKNVLVFNLESKEWDRPLTCKYFRSSLVIVNNKPIAVGGTSDCAEGSSCTKELVNILDLRTDENSIWTTMNEPRSRCTSITYTNGNNTYLIVAGGEHPVGNNLKTVEVLNITTNNIIMSVSTMSCSLPGTRHSCSAAIVNDNLYLLGGWIGCDIATRKVFKCSIQDLIKSCCPSNQMTSTETWTTLDAELPVAQSTCVSFNNKLLTFGGTWCECYDCKCNRPSREIYVYDDDNETFECIGSTPDAQYLCFACVFQGSNIFIAGGAEDEEKALKDVYTYYAYH